MYGNLGYDNRSQDSYDDLPSLRGSTTGENDADDSDDDSVNLSSVCSTDTGGDWNITGDELR